MVHFRDKLQQRQQGNLEVSMTQMCRNFLTYAAGGAKTIPTCGWLRSCRLIVHFRGVTNIHPSLPSHLMCSSTPACSLCTPAQHVSCCCCSSARPPQIHSLYLTFIFKAKVMQVDIIFTQLSRNCFLNHTSSKFHPSSRLLVFITHLTPQFHLISVRSQPGIGFDPDLFFS